uniref:DUF4283 domain-containing protein n=1 Tax=Tanacetum cinerariifolium TaxID=118510 RepID=A0A6L2KQM3_TANCI|nr:hypothetical protein [Tanacetum cinerariifolium]
MSKSIHENNVEISSASVDNVGVDLEKGTVDTSAKCNSVNDKENVNAELKEKNVESDQCNNTKCDGKSGNMNRNEKFKGAWDKSSKFSDILAASKLDNRLLMIPTEISESGEEDLTIPIRLYDLDLAKAKTILGRIPILKTLENRSNKWSLKVCGQFVSCSMRLNEVRYHIRRMWNKFGLKDIIVNESGIFLFKLHDNEGIDEVINNGPWMVNNKTMFVHSLKGISALASSLGKPIIMEEVTTRMCLTGEGRVGFARVLVEINAEKEIKDKIEIVYKGKNITDGLRKVVEVEYAWKPFVCEHCKVFGHDVHRCIVKPRITTETRTEKQNENVFTEVNNKRSRGETNANSKNGFGKFGQYRANTFQHRGDNTIKENTKKQNVGRFEYRKINVNQKADEVLLNRGKEKVTKDSTSSKERQERSCMYKEYSGKGSGNGKPKEQAQESNRFSLLDSLINEEDLVPNVKEREEVDVFLKRKLEPTTTDKERWSNNMKRYYRDKKELMDAVEELEVEEDKHKVKDNPWIIVGDFNVTLDVCEHSNGSSNSSNDMKDFQECINEVEMTSEIVKKNKPFRFSNFVTQKKEFQKIVEKEWEKGNVHERVEKCRGELKKMQMDEVNLLYQKAKVEWLQEGDYNTAYFHKILKGRKHKGRIVEVSDESGQRFENEEVAEPFLKHFKKNLGTKDFVKPIDEYSGIFVTKLTQGEVESMIKEVTDKEIREAIFDIDNDKAPGPDGFTSNFFKKAWKTVGEDVCRAIKEFFDSGKMLGELNATVISLMPKVKTPCCNVIYKGIIDGNNWKWPAEWYAKYPVLNSIQVPVFNEMEEDALKWEKLLTQDRILKWKPNGILECALCGRKGIFGKDKRNTEVLFIEIVEFIKMKLMYLMVKDSKEVKRVELIWDVKLHRVNGMTKRD